MKLQTLLPWLTPMSKSVSLVLKFSPIQQSMLVAYAMHDAVSGERCATTQSSQRLRCGLQCGLSAGACRATQQRDSCLHNRPRSSASGVGSASPSSPHGQQCVEGLHRQAARTQPLAHTQALHAHVFVQLCPSSPFPTLDPSADYFTACLAWLEGGGKVDAQPLAHQLVVPGFNLSALTPDRRYPPPPPLPAAEDQDSQPKAHAQQLEAPSSDAKPRRRSQDL